MSSNISIQACGLSKAYQLGQFGANTVKESIVRFFSKSLRSGVNVDSDKNPNLFWALRDVNLEVSRGEVIGIIGHNGAGKSTLLKLLSRITEPTQGEAVLYGSVASLLEVGTGFHPELTGRENVYLNGTILGLKRWEIARQFDEIVEFADIERFIDTPVKRYSSGMYVRLAFAVAAHLNPDIMIIDEVLAVGDAGFQKKCIDKMENVAHQGRTVLFVSHNMDAIKLLTKRCLVLEKGRITYEGDSVSAVAHYLGSSAVLNGGYVRITDEHRRNVTKETNREILLRGITLSNLKTHQIKDCYVEGEPISVDLELDFRVPMKRVEIVLQIYRHDGLLVTSLLTGEMDVSVPNGKHRIKSTLINPAIASGKYKFSVYILSGSRKAQDYIPDAISFSIQLDPNRRYETREISGLYNDVLRQEKKWGRLTKID